MGSGRLHILDLKGMAVAAKGWIDRCIHCPVLRLCVPMGEHLAMDLGAAAVFASLLCRHWVFLLLRRASRLITFFCQDGLDSFQYGGLEP